MEIDKLKRANEIQADILELEYFRKLLESYFSGKAIEATITIKYDGDIMQIPKTNANKNL